MNRTRNLFRSEARPFFLLLYSVLAVCCTKVPASMGLHDEAVAQEGSGFSARCRGLADSRDGIPLACQPEYACAPHEHGAHTNAGLVWIKLPTGRPRRAGA